MTENGWSVLHFAAFSGHQKMVQLLIDEKHDVNAETKKAWTPAHLAADQGHLKVVQLLYRH